MRLRALLEIQVPAVTWHNQAHLLSSEAVDSICEVSTIWLPIYLLWEIWLSAKNIYVHVRLPISKWPSVHAHIIGPLDRLMWSQAAVTQQTGTPMTNIGSGQTVSTFYSPSAYLLRAFVPLKLHPVTVLDNNLLLKRGLQHVYGTCFYPLPGTFRLRPSRSTRTIRMSQNTSWQKAAREKTGS